MEWTRWDAREAASDEDLPAREAAGTRSLLRGLMWLGALALLFAIARAGLDRAFIPGWWKPW